MRTPIIDGLSIEQFIPANLRGMFYNHPMPEYKYAIHNGKDPYGFSTNGLILYLPFWALKDGKFKSVDAYKHTCTVTGATWGIQGRSFNGTDAYIDCGRDSSLNMGIGDFSIGAWVYLDAIITSQYIANKGQVGAGGKRYRLLYEITDGKVYFNLDDDINAPNVLSSTSLAKETWYLVLATADRDGNLNMYINGAVDGTPVANTATLTIDDTSKDFCVGIYSGNEADLPLGGRVGEVWLYNRLLSATDVLNIYQSTKWRY